MEDTIIKLRHIRVLGISSFELLLTFGFGLFFANTPYEWVQYLLIIILIGVVTHWAFDVNTALNWKLGLSDCPPDFDSVLGIFKCDKKLNKHNNNYLNNNDAMCQTHNLYDSQRTIVHDL